MEEFRALHVSSSSASPPPWIPTAEEPAQAPAAAPSPLLDREHMFDKVVTPSDVGKLNRLVIPKQYAEKFLPLDASLAIKGLVLSFEDRAGKRWCFRYSYWSSSQSYVMTKGWSRFVKEKRLDAGDTVSFSRGAAGGRYCRLFIDLQHRKHPTRYPPLPLAQPTGLPWGGSLMAPSTSTLSMHGGGSRSPYFYYESAAWPPHVGMQSDVRSDTVAGMPMILDAVPVAFGAAKPKAVRLFGVNLECPKPESSSNSQLLPSVVED